MRKLRQGREETLLQQKNPLCNVVCNILFNPAFRNREKKKKAVTTRN